MALFPVLSGRANFDSSDNAATDTFSAGIRYTQAGAVRTTPDAGTVFNQGIPMSASGQVAVLDATAGLPADVTWLSGMPISGNKVCVSTNAVSAVSSGTPYDAAGAVAGSGYFIPRMLFLSGAEGVWYDPSDSSTLFSDTAGTTPCAAPGAGALVNVGLMLDKSKGLVLGSELVPDPDFNTPASWTATPPDWVVSGGKATYTDPGSGNQFIESNGNISIVSGNWYKVTFVLSGIASGTALLGLFDKAATVNYFGSYRTYSANGTYSVYFLATSSTTGIRIYGNSSGTAASWSLESFSIQTISGNHAISYNSTTARPELSARVNLLTYSEQFDNAVWQKLAAGTGVVPVVTPNAGTAPDGTLTADRVVFNRGAGTTGSDISYLNQTITSVSSDCTESIWLRTFDGSNQTIVLRVGNTFNYAVAVTGTWTRFSLTGTAPITRVDLLSYGDRQPQITDLLIWGADLRPTNIGANVPAYQRIADQYTYDTVGFPRYLRFDGVDDGMSTPANLNLSATDKATVFAGVRKLSDAATGQVVETSVDWFSNNGALALSVPFGAASNYGFVSKGTTAQSASSSATAPVSSVLCGIGNISAPAVTLRVNGVQTATTAFPQGTGNYGSYPLFIGSRANSSLWFNGYLYSLVVVGAASTAAQISSTESWIAGKEGVQL